MTPLQSVREFAVSERLVEHTSRALRKAGTEGYELFVLWTGVPNGEVFDVRTSHVPRQTSHKTKHGLLVRVEGQALHDLNMWMYEHGETLGAQIHAHPDGAYHSSTDDKHPIVTCLGGLSLVAADFARAGILAPSSAAYRLSASGWNRVSLDVIRFIPNGAS